MDSNPSRIDIVRAMDELLCCVEERREHLFRRYQSNHYQNNYQKVHIIVDFPLYLLRDRIIDDLYTQLDILARKLQKMEREEYTPVICLPTPSNYKHTN